MPPRYNPIGLFEFRVIGSMAMHRQYASPLTFALAMLSLIGCSGNADRPYAAAEERLLNIGNAYLNAASGLGRPPTGFDDIKPFLEGDVTEEYMRSPGDGEPFVILWAIDYNALPPGQGDPFTVAAYEKNGANGKRYVLRFPRSVVLMSDAELRNAVFPAGHGPPQ